MRELRCEGCKSLLMKITGTDYRIEIVCRKCDRFLVFEPPARPTTRLEEVVLNRPNRPGVKRRKVQSTLRARDGKVEHHA